MPIINIRKKLNPYVVLDKTFINDKALSLKSKGLLAYLLSLPPAWKIHVKELENHFPDGKHAIYSALKELKEHRYVLHFRSRCKNGNYGGAEYHVFEVPQPHPENQDMDSSPDADFPDVDNPDMEKRDTENQTLLNNKNNKYINNKIITAAIDVEPHSTTSSHPAAASLISNELSLSQCRCVQRVATDMAEAIPDCSPEQLEEEITHSLLDPNAFSKAGPDFFKKLNTIQKCIRDGKWQSPASLHVEKETKFQKQMQPLVQKLRELQSDQRHLRWMAETMEQSGKKDEVTSFYGQIQKQEKVIIQVSDQIKALERRKV